ncbi:hypothetical protein BGZ97_009781 [Linnemannia gamsii]|uniref:WD40 repeat-like protein n=1 Tax=Linnemannia gamsii TaxID=64522 RepID=A0A9P6R9I3_9FUNG|nr:hypothetical protein BGZ97_009781 [Linnemannia gamsii]
MDKALPDMPSSVQQPCLTIFPQNVAAPVLSTILLPPGARFEDTVQLANCNYLLRRCLSPSLAVGSITASLNATHQAVIDSYAQSEDETARVRWLTQRLVGEFVADSLKSSAGLSEVVLLASSLDQEYFRKLLNCIIAEFEAAALLDVNMLQGLGKVKDLRCIIGHEPLSALLDQLKDSADPYLKHQATYASQALLHVPNDETRRELVWQHAGNTMGLLGVASVCKLDLSQLKDGTEHLHKIASETHTVDAKVADSVQALHETGQDICTSIKGGILSGGRLLWYSALREAQEHILNGRLQDFNRFVFEAPCRNHVEFQWGICCLLGGIAVDPRWDTITSQHAVEFLGELYKNTAIFSPHEDVHKWILNILRHIGELADVSASGYARLTLQELEKEGDSDKQEVYRATLASPSSPYPINTRLSIPTSSPLLTRVLATPDIEYDLHRLRMQRLADHRGGIYIPPQAKPSLQAADDTLFPLMEKVQEFLGGQRQVFLVMGDSGAGKSTFNLELEHALWRDYKKYGPIPLYINLPTVDNPAQDLIKKQLLRHKFSEAQIQEMKLHRQFILICDGYDETQLKVNLITTNQFNREGQWRVKVVISCRSQYLGQDYRSLFQPQAIDRYRRSATDDFQEAVVAEFSRAQIQHYVEQYVKGLPAADDPQDRPSWTKEEYMDKLTRIPNLMDLVSNPFLLTLTLEALPTFVASKKDLSAIRITRVQLYDNFVRQWLEVNRVRPEASPMNDGDRSELDLLMENSFLFRGTLYEQNLTTQFKVRHAKTPVIQYTHLHDKDTWKATFVSPHKQAELLQESSTVTRSGAYFRFLHRSLQEYFYSRTIYDPLDYSNGDGSPSPEVSTASTAKTGLLSMDLVGESSILQFLAERAQTDAAFKTDLLSVIEDSKTDAEVAQAASNAISVLVKANVPMNSMDFRGIRIPGADLRGGQFDSTNFEGADLTNVNFEKTWLRQANLRRTQLKNVQFGEWRYFKVNGRVWTSSFSADGRFLAVTTRNLEVTIFETTRWESVFCGPSGLGLAFAPTGYELALGVKGSESVQVLNILTGQVRFVLRGHQHVVVRITYSPDGSQLATGCIDATVRIWSTADGDTLHVLSGHAGPVWGVAYSPTGLQLVSGGEDKTVRTWDVQTGKPLKVLEAHLGPVQSVAYSPDGYQIASGSDDKTVRLWDVYTSEVTHTLSGHLGQVLSVAYSPDGRQVASGGRDMTLRLWDPHSGDPYGTLRGHVFQDVGAVAYAPTSNYMASGDDGGYIRFWKAPTNLTFAALERKTCVFVGISADGRWMTKVYNDDTFELLETLMGATRVVSVVLVALMPFQRPAVSSCGSMVATMQGSFAVRIWNVEAETGTVLHDLVGHTGYVKVVAFSYDSSQLISASMDKTLRVWDTTTSETVFVLEGIDESVNSITFSPSGHQIASCDEDKVLVWSAETGEKLFTLDNSGGIGRFGYSLDGRYIISSAHSKHICWDTESGERSDRFVALDTEFFTFSFSPNGRFLATTGREGLLRIWDVYSDAEGGCKLVYQTMLEITYLIFWKVYQGEQYLVTMNSGLSPVIYKVLIGKQPGAFRLELAYAREGPEVLFLESVVMDNADGLSIPNLKLLKQRGATGSGAIRLQLRKLDDGTYQVIE